MVPDLSEVTGLGNFTAKTESDPKSNQAVKERTIFFRGDKAFLVKNDHTIEVRCDEKLSKHLINEYESVMESRYFGRGGIEIIPAGQLSRDDLADLIRLSYNLSE